MCGPSLTSLLAAPILMVSASILESFMVRLLTTSIAVLLAVLAACTRHVRLGWTLEPKYLPPREGQVKVLEGREAFRSWIPFTNISKKPFSLIQSSPVLNIAGSLKQA